METVNSILDALITPEACRFEPAPVNLYSFPTSIAGVLVEAPKSNVLQSDEANLNSPEISTSSPAG